MDSLDVLVGLARAAARRGTIRLSKEDFVGAFKTLPLRWRSAYGLARASAVPRVWLLMQE